MNQLQPKQCEKQVNEEAHELPLLYDTPQTSVMSCSLVPSILLIILSESLRNSPPLQTLISQVLAAAILGDTQLPQTSLLTALPTLPHAENPGDPFRFLDKEIYCIDPGASDRWDRKIERSGISIF